MGLHRHLFLHEVFLPCLLLNVQPLLQVSELSRMSPANLILHPARIEHKLTLTAAPWSSKLPSFQWTEKLGRRLRMRVWWNLSMLKYILGVNSFSGEQIVQSWSREIKSTVELARVVLTQAHPKQLFYIPSPPPLSPLKA